MHTTPLPSQPQRRAAAAGSVHFERHRPEQTTLYRLVQQHAASFIAHTETSTGSELPSFIKAEFDAFLECSILAHGFLRLRCGDCGHDKLKTQWRDGTTHLVMSPLEFMQRQRWCHGHGCT